MTNLDVFSIIKSPILNTDNNVWYSILEIKGLVCVDFSDRLHKENVIFDRSFLNNLVSTSLSGLNYIRTYNRMNYWTIIGSTDGAKPFFVLIIL